MLNWDANPAPQATLLDTHILYNTSNTQGGGVFNQAGSMQLERCTLLRNTAPQDMGADSFRLNGTLSLKSVSLADDFTSKALGLTANTTPRPEWRPNMRMAVQGGLLNPTYDYNRQFAAQRAISLSRSNFVNFPTTSVASVVGFVDTVQSRRPRDYGASLNHISGQGTGSSIFISEMLHYGGLPMVKAPAPPFCSGDDLNFSGVYTLRGWRYCRDERTSSLNWKFHPGITQFFGSLTGLAMPRIGSVTSAQIIGFIWTDANQSVSDGRPQAGRLKVGSEVDPNNSAAMMIARFAPGGALSSVGIGDYLYIESHGFLIVGWGPLLGTIEGINYALVNSLGTTRSDSNPIPYIADFCYGEKDGQVGWQQDPRPRPFYAAATRVYQVNLTIDQKTYLRKSTVPGTLEPFYERFVLVNTNYDFYKMPDTIVIGDQQGVINIPFGRLLFEA